MHGVPEHRHADGRRRPGDRLPPKTPTSANAATSRAWCPKAARCARRLSNVAPPHQLESRGGARTSLSPLTSPRPPRRSASGIRPRRSPGRAPSRSCGARRRGGDRWNDRSAEEKMKQTMRRMGTGIGSLAAWTPHGTRPA